MAASVEVPSVTSLPSLTSLVGHLLAAKGSLACTDHLSRANEIVTATKEALVQHAATHARTRFLLSGCAIQLTSLAQLCQQLRGILDESRRDLDLIVKGVQAAEDKLNQTLDGLRNTIVDPNLRPSNEDSKTLLDFVEGANVQTLLADVWSHVQASQTARDHFAETISRFEQDLGTITTSLTTCGHIEQDTSAGSLQSLLQTLESSAYEMAQNFESLVKHYDLCLNALRNTEGAGAALYQAPNNDLSADQNAALAQEIETTEDSVSADDREHMLTVLSEDAQQVDDVVDEICESLGDMEANFSSASSFVSAVDDGHREAVAAFALLDSVNQRLTHYVTQSHLFILRKDDEQAIIAEKQIQLRELTQFYSGFLGAYDKLIIEVGRRKDAARRMQRVQEEALAKLDALYQEDAEERDNFRTSQGEFLPIDIWPGLMAPTPRYEIALVDGDASVPDISASVVQKAIRRVRGRTPFGD